MISIHAPQWGATERTQNQYWDMDDFNPRTPVGCDCFFSSSAAWLDIFQSTHPSGVRPGCRRLPLRAHGISIHAPQWGATRQIEESARHADISIHAPQWGATYVHCLSTINAVISIHAPQWGATHLDVAISGVGLISIHAPQWGATRCESCSKSARYYFNPRTPVGCDALALWSAPAWLISIHAPQWGATRSCSIKYSFAVISIHAPQWGATCRKPCHACCLRISIHAPQWGATQINGASTIGI